MKYLLEIANAVATKKEDTEIHRITQTQKDEIKNETTKASDEDIGEIISHLFPSGTPISTDFYDTLKNFQHLVGYGPIFYTLGGRIWARAYTEIAKDKQNLLLDSLFEERGRGVWRAIFYLPEFCSLVEIEAQFAAGWFYRFGDVVKSDMANWDFFDGLKNYAANFPVSGMKVFEKYMTEQLNKLRINLAALLLGTIRSKAEQGYYEKDIVVHWNEKLLKSSQINMRLIYYRSLPIPFDLGCLSVQELNKELAVMMRGEAEEISEAFYIIWRCLRSERADDDFVQFAMDWFSKNASSRLPDEAKYHLVNAMWFFSTPGQKKDIEASEADNLLVAIQPIPENNNGTWKYFELYLVERLHKDSASFGNILGRFVNANPKGMLTKFQGESFEYLQSEICGAKEQDFLTEWLLSTDKNKRRIAKAIFQKSKAIVLSQNIVSKASEEQLEIALLEFIRRPLIDAEKTSAYLLALEPAFRKVKMELKKAFKNEMVLQAINYPGACLDNWKKIEKPSDLLKDVIADAEKYFERLNAIEDSPGISFSFPGCKEAIEREAREFSSKVTGEAKDKSIFAKLAKNVHIIYGTRWSIMMEGKLGGTQDFNKLRVSMEFPRLEAIDPEGMAIRRLRSASNIKGTENGK